MSSDPITDITICMGSSCFSRGNSRNIQVVQNLLAQRQLPSEVQVSGHLCENLCCQGPNVTINGQLHQNVDPVVLKGLLQHYSNDIKT